MARYLLIPLTLCVLVIGPFLIWGEELTSLYDVEGTSAALEAGRAAWIVGVGLMALDLFLPIPTTAVIAALGIFYGPILGALVALAGSMLAASLGYALGRIFGRPFAARFLGPSAERGERLFGAYGGWIVCASRWAPVLPEVVSVMAGVARMPFPAFLAAAFCGALPLSAVFATAGHLGRDAPTATLIASAVLPLVLWIVADRSGLTRRLGLRS